jgi:hypothetical protein
MLKSYIFVDPKILAILGAITLGNKSYLSFLWTRDYVAIHLGSCEVWVPQNLIMSASGSRE